MKVTVNFGAVRVIVPCGKGELLVRQLMDLAITRYKKATGKSLDSWVTIHNLKILSDGGILDPDDKLNDVADDREQIIATFEEQSLPYLSHNGGDGTSASSVGTESPDIFQNGELISTNLTKPLYNGSDVEITADDIASGILPLHVRRGSEPVLNRLSPSPLADADPSKRWSAAIMVDGDCLKSLNSEGENSEQSEDEPPPGEREDGSGEEKSTPTQLHSNSKFSAFDIALEELTWKNERRLNNDKRREPLGGPRTSPKLGNDGDDSDCSSITEKKEVVKLKNEEGPLGIHVVPATDCPGKDFGLIIQGIEPGGRIDRDGRFSVGDRITEINGLTLSKESFQKAQEIFKDALKAPEISIHCIKSNISHPPIITSKRISPPPVYPKPILPIHRKDNDSSDGLTEDEKACLVFKPVFLTPTRKTSVFCKSPSSAHSSIRKVGRRILIHLTKGSEGLGFSISAKDTSNNTPLFVKNILPAGAAVEDGRLKVADRILEVNNIDVTGKSQAEVVNLLRKVPFGDNVELVVSRQETDNSPSPSLPRELPPEKAGDGVGIFPWKKREVFTFDIPLNDTGSAGLGVSVKGKTSTTPNGAIDMGIFVKSVIHGGAASKDGRLWTNDQLLNINGISLLAMTNSQAMETLRRAMIQGEGPNAIPNAITLTVARRIPSQGPDGNNECVDGSYHDRSDSLLSESGDSFYVSNENVSSVNNKVEGVTPDTSTSDNSGNTVILMSQCQTNSIINDSNYSKDSTLVAASNNRIQSPLPGNNPVIERLTGFNDNEPELSSRLRNEPCLFTSLNKWGGVQMQEVLNLMDADLEEYPLFSTRPPEKDTKFLPDRKSMLVHQKSFSSPAKIECHSPVALTTRKDERTNFVNLPSSPKTKTAIPNHVPLEDANFYRNGFGRQSMPEKRFIQASRQERGNLRNGNIVQSEVEFHSRQTPVDQQNSNNSSKEHIPKEMPVDVGPCETYAKVLPNKLQRTRAATLKRENASPAWSNSADSLASLNQVRSCIQQGSCRSPGCPYHAVPLTGRESGSSQATSVQYGPSLGMCKSSSLESLQTMVHELQKRDAPLVTSSKDNGGRGCNESFRAAVDRSYEAPDSETMETVQEVNENANGLIHRPNVTRGHVRSATVDIAPDALAGKKNGKTGKKKGLFKGLGSVFRFGKSNKKANNELAVAKKEDKQQELERIEARKAAQEEQERIQEHYQKLVEQQRLKQFEALSQQIQRQNMELPNGCLQATSTRPFTPPAKHVPQSNNPMFSPQPQSRQERMHFLRAEHQRRHQQRQGYYPQEEQEELYEERIRQIIDGTEMRKRPLPPLPHQTVPPFFPAGHNQGYEYETSHSRSQSFDIYKEMSKPGSRKGFVDPNRYSHYMNFQEIQQHLQQFQNHQNLLKSAPLTQMMSQFQQDRPLSPEPRTPTKLQKPHYRHTLNSPRTRPISNFFEYESVHNSKSPSKCRSESGASSLPRRSFTSGRQRLPIPAYMRFGKQNSKTESNWYAASDNQFNLMSTYGSGRDVCYSRKVDVPSSKV